MKIKKALFIVFLLLFYFYSFAAAENNPSAIQLNQFYAVLGNGEITLHWNTETEPDNAGFDIFRSASKSGPYEQINDFRIPAKGGAFEGATYEYTDDTIEEDTVYWYKLKDIDLSGHFQFHGPVYANNIVFGTVSAATQNGVVLNLYKDDVWQWYQKIGDQGRYRFTINLLTKGCDYGSECTFSVVPDLEGFLFSPSFYEFQIPHTSFPDEYEASYIERNFTAACNPEVNGTPCDDGLFCTAVDTCQDGECIGSGDPCSDGETCNEDTKSCDTSGGGNGGGGGGNGGGNETGCKTDSDCTADETTPFCDTDTGKCVQCLADENCDNGEFCDGEEICADGVCQDGTLPCSEEEICDEEQDKCFIPPPPCQSDDDCEEGLCDTASGSCLDVECLDSELHCDDGIFCNGQETCDENKTCQQGVPPCSQDQVCREETAQCWNTRTLEGYVFPPLVLRPFFRETRCTFVFVYVNDSHASEQTTVNIIGPNEDAKGISKNERKNLIPFTRGILIPLCISQTATRGSWKLSISTDVEIENTPTVESIEATFQVH